MKPDLRNFFRSPALHAHKAALKKVLPPSFQSRSLPGVSPVAIPGRYSSSSLPPFFVSGRFAIFCLPAQVVVSGQGV